MVNHLRRIGYKVDVASFQTKCGQQSPGFSSRYCLHDLGRVSTGPSPAQQHAEATGGRLQGRLLVRARRGPLSRRNLVPLKRNFAPLPLPAARNLEQADQRRGPNGHSLRDQPHRVRDGLFRRRLC